MTVFQDRWYQDEAVESLFQFYSEPRKIVDGKPERKNALICMPTATGKSIVIGKFIKRCFDIVPNTKVMMITHVKELIKQNAGKLQELWPTAPLGIFSAGLKQRDHIQPIIFGGIKSVAGKLIFGHVDFLVIDEAHLLADEGQYVQLINELMLVNPYLKVIGLTATPYRMGMGLMTNGKIFTHIVYDISDLKGFARLIAEGYLCPLIPRRTSIQLDISGVGIRNGDYIPGELERAVDVNETNYSVVQEFLGYAQDRNCGLMFASGIKHAEHLWELCNDVFKQETVILHSKRTDDQNTKAMEDWKAGKVKFAVNMNMLTTGVDNPMLDIIGDAQPTCSTGKHVQKYGRATRVFPGKSNGLILDFAGNTRRLGPINDPLIPRPKGQGSPGDAPVRICPQCGTYNHASVRICCCCGKEFDFSPILTRNASTIEVMKSDLPEIELFKVEQVSYKPFLAKSGRPWIRVAYRSGLRTFFDIKTLEGGDYPSKQGRDWFRQIYGEPFEGMKNSDVLALLSYLRMPNQIRVWINKSPQPQVMGQEM